MWNVSIRGSLRNFLSITSGYHHIDIHPLSGHFPTVKHATFLFLVLPFGLSSACYVFTKVLRPLVKKWRTNGFRSIMYIHDGIPGSCSYQNCLDCASVISYDLAMAGFVISQKKSDFILKQTGEWLGTIVDTSSMTFTVPERKILKLKPKVI